MASVIYNSCAIIPAPLVTFQDEPIIAGNQERIGNTYRMTINGTLVSYKGSPASAPFGGQSQSANWGGYNNQYWVTSNYPPDETNPSMSFHQLYMMESKQEALRTLFATEGQWLEFQSMDGSTPLKCQIKGVRLDFEQGIWFTECKYTITCETDVLYLNGQIYQGLPVASGGLIQQANETWEIQPNTQFVKTFDVVHTVNVVGKRSFDSLGNEPVPAWQIAKNYINTQLSLGWSGATSFSPYAGGSIFNQSTLASGSLNLSTYTPYNFSRNDSIDELAGSYQVVERWEASPTPSGYNVYTINTRTIVDDPYCNVVSNIQGTIHGYYDGLLNYDQRLPAAQYYWNTFVNGATGLLSLITNNYSGYTYNVQPRQGALDYNQNEGTISYNYEFSNQLYENDAFETYAVSRKTSTDIYLTTFGIAGTIKGRRYDGDTNVLAPAQRAYAWFATISGNNYSTLYNRILSSTYWPEASGLGLLPEPVSKTIDINESEGLISYSVEYNNRANPGAFPADSATDEWQISKRFDRQDGITHYVINGTVKGLNIIDVNPIVNKFANASGYFYTYTLPNLYNRILTYYGVSIPDTNPLSIEIGTFPSQGEITYQYEYSSLFPPILSGALSENITVTDNNYNAQVQVIAQIPIPGRTSGPVLQDVQTTQVKSRSINIEAVVGPTGDVGGNILVAYNTKPSYDGYVLQLMPVNGKCQNWQSTWDWRFGRYTLSAEFIYE
jgi:hypothetical protein